GRIVDEPAWGVPRVAPRARLEAVLAEGLPGGLTLGGDHRRVALLRHRGIVDRHEMDLGPLALDPREPRAQHRRRRDLRESPQLPERDAVAHLIGPDLERDVLEHAPKPTPD